MELIYPHSTLASRYCLPDRCKKDPETNRVGPTPIKPAVGVRGSGIFVGGRHSSRARALALEAALNQRITERRRAAGQRERGDPEAAVGRSKDNRMPLVRSFVRPLLGWLVGWFVHIHIGASINGVTEEILWSS